MLKDIKNELLGCGMDFIKLDNTMMSYGFNNTLISYGKDWIISDGNGVWTSKDMQIQIFFKGNANYLIVLDIVKFD